MTTNFKNAKNLIKENVIKLENNINTLVVSHEDLTKKLNESLENNINIFEKFVDRSPKPNSKQIEFLFKRFIQDNKELIEATKDKIISLNKDYGINNKELLSSVSGLGLSVEKRMKDDVFGVTKKSQKLISVLLMSEYESIINNFAHSLDIESKSLNKTFTDITRKLPKHSSKMKAKEHISYISHMDLSINKLLEIFVRADKSVSSKKFSKEISENRELSNLLDVFLQKNEFKTIKNKLESINVSAAEIKQGEAIYSHINNVEDIRRSKQAIDGVKSSLDEAVSCFRELIDARDYDCIGMFIGDMRDHLKLSKDCLTNNVLEMEKYGDMDTASRDLINEKLWEYMNTEDFENQCYNALSLKSNSKKKKLK